MSDQEPDDITRPFTSGDGDFEHLKPLMSRPTISLELRENVHTHDSLDLEDVDVLLDDLGISAENGLTEISHNVS